MAANKAVEVGDAVTAVPQAEEDAGAQAALEVPPAEREAEALAAATVERAGASASKRVQAHNLDN